MPIDATFLWCFLILYSFASFDSGNAVPNVEPSKCKIFGPGIENSAFHMPIRYFFVTLMDAEGRRLNESAGDAFILVANLNQTSCSIWTTVTDRHDGSYVVRYRIFSKCYSLNLAITTPEGRHFAKSPYMLKGPMYTEICYCPQNMNQWFQSMNCPTKYDQIENDLSSWHAKSVNFSWVLEESYRKWGSHPGAFSYCHYIILDNRISRKCYGQHVGFTLFSDAILLSLTRKVRLPNVEFLMNLGDWPLEKRGGQDTVPFVPVLSWCGSEDTTDIVLPTYELTESTLGMMSKVSLDIFTAEKMASKIPWNDKIEKGFWRGRDSNEARLEAVKLSRANPELMDAGITHVFFFQDRMDDIGETVPVVDFGHFFKYKYQVNLDGTVAAYRLPYLLAGNGLVFKQDSSYYEFFYSRLKPYVHYVPVQKDLSDLLEKIEWARENDSKAKEISRQARLFARSHLNPKEIFCYYAHVLQAYSKILSKEPIEIPKENGFQNVYQPEEAGRCGCEGGDLEELEITDVEEPIEKSKQPTEDTAETRHVAKDEL